MKKFTAFCIAMLLLLAPAMLTACGNEAKEPLSDISSGAIDSSASPDDGTSSPDTPSDMPSENSSGAASDPEDDPSSEEEEDRSNWTELDWFGVPVDDGVFEYQLQEKKYYRLNELLDKTATAVEIPATLAGKPVEIISNRAFMDCDRLRSVTIPEGIRTIYETAFMGCTALEEITLPASLTLLDGNPFRNCPNLRAIHLAEGNTTYKLVDGVLFKADGSELVLYPAARDGSEYTVPDGVTTVGEYAFSACSKLKSLTLSEGVETVYSEPNNGTYYYRDSPFENSTIDHLYLPKSLKTITFSDLSCIANIEVADGSGLCQVVDGALLSMSGERLLLYPKARPEERYEIPEGVKSIAKNAISGEGALKTVRLPASVIACELPNFTGLEAIEVDEGNKDFKSVDGVLFDAAGETLRIYPSGRPNESYRIPDGVTTVSDSFSANLKKLILSPSVKKIDGGPLYENHLERIEVEDGNETYKAVDGILLSADGTALVCYPSEKPDEEYTLPEGITRLSRETLVNDHLKVLRFPDTLRSIPASTAAEKGFCSAIICHSLEQLYIPASVKTIGRVTLQVPVVIKVYCEIDKALRGWEPYWLYDNDDYTVADGKTKVTWSYGAEE